MSDSAIFEISQQSDIDAQKFINKSVLYVLDSNQGSYAGNQINIETSSLANSGRWLSFRDSYLMIPIVIAMKSSRDITAANPSPFSCGFKNGFYQLIDSMTVELNGQNIVQLCPYTNVWTNFKVVSTWSKDTLTKYGPSLGVFPDASTSVGVAAAASGNGIGLYNNNVYGLPSSLSDANFVGSSYNAGFLQRMYSTGFTVGGVNGAGALYANPGSTGMSFFTNDGGAAAARVYYWSIIAKVRLRDIHDYFDKVPLLKGSYYRFVINVNTSAFTLAVVGAGPTMSIATPASVTVSGRTNPIMVASCDEKEPLNGPVAAGNGTLAFSVGIGRTSPPGGAQVTNRTFESGCRLYVPTFQMNPEYEEQYISLHPTKTIEYAILQMGTKSTPFD
jgi:hypothetical protein